jgi:predicted Ser/Thr protein kinase
MPDVGSVTCAACGAEAPGGARFCLACGGRLGSDDLPTFSSPPRDPASPRTAGSDHARPRSSSAPSGEGRFLPGTVLGGRYRIVELLGRGGMGEVYRADDLTLSQPVALKFLPETAPPDILERFRSEVRIARRVSHPNVCRVYDVGEADGRHFLSMEYVDGEDLASLLRRIGRLPADKALDVARRVCAGLAAAHAKGVLHRDLKPSNVMLDGGGNALITDFGLAAVVGQIAAGDVRSGTPAYMAPEQLENREVTVRSDVYALGLLLYEVFTGKRAYEGRTLAEIVRQRNESAPSSPSSIVRDLDPAVERVILRCVERDPQQRPSSVLGVAAALPGGDPLAAALAAGETPSPQLVADAGETGSLSPRAALACLGLAVGALAVVTVFLVRAAGLDAVGLLSPETLAVKARETIESLGYTAPPADTAQGFAFDEDLERLLEKERRPDWSATLGSRLPLVTFWYRTSPERMVRISFDDNHLTPGHVTTREPPPIVPGMVNLSLDVHGRLLEFQAIPPEQEAAPSSAPAPSWDALFAAAGLEASSLQPASPEWVSLAASDVRAAWTGTWPGTDRPLRVEAAAFHGRPVFFSTLGPWSRPRRALRAEESGERAAEIVSVATVSVLLGLAVFLGRRNHVKGRGDVRGALRLAGFVFAAGMTLWACRTHPLGGMALIGMLLMAVANSLFVAGVFWLLYMALEPYVRRRWPQAIISWSRIVAGRFRDPLVGRDVIWGVILGLLWAGVIDIQLLALQRTSATPHLGSLAYLDGGRAVLGAWLGVILNSVQATLLFFFALFLLRVLLRRPWLAAAAFVVVFALPQVLVSRHPAVEVPTAIALYAIALIAVLRFGLVTLAVGIWTVDVLLSVPATASLGSWYAGPTLFVLATILGAAAWGFWTALGGRPLWTGEAFD